MASFGRADPPERLVIGLDRLVVALAVTQDIALKNQRVDLVGALAHHGVEPRQGLLGALGALQQAGRAHARHSAQFGIARHGVIDGDGIVGPIHIVENVA